MAEPITLDELLAEIERLGGVGDENADGQTTAELAAEWGVGRERVRSLLHHAKGLGLLEIGSRVEANLAGKKQRVTVYRIVKPQAPKKASKK